MAGERKRQRPFGRLVQHIHTHTDRETLTNRSFEAPWSISGSVFQCNRKLSSSSSSSLTCTPPFSLIPPILYRRCCIHTPSYNVGKRKLENSFFFLFLFSFKRMSFKKERKAFPISECQPVLLLELSSSLLTPCWFRRPLAFKLISFPLLVLVVFCFVFLLYLSFFVHRNNHSTFDVLSAWDPICVMIVLFSQVYNEKEKKKNAGKRIKNKRKYEGFFCVC